MSGGWLNKLWFCSPKSTLTLNEQSEETPLRKKEKTSYFNNWLSEEICFHIFSYLKPEDLFILSKVCRLWKAISEDDRLWRPLYRQIDCLTEDDQSGLRELYGRTVKKLDQDLIYLIRGQPLIPVEESLNSLKNLPKVSYQKTEAKIKILEKMTGCLINHLYRSTILDQFENAYRPLTQESQYLMYLLLVYSGDVPLMNRLLTEKVAAIAPKKYWDRIPDLSRSMSHSITEKHHKMLNYLLTTKFKPNKDHVLQALHLSDTISLNMLLDHNAPLYAAHLDVYAFPYTDRGNMSSKKAMLCFEKLCQEAIKRSQAPDRWNVCLPGMLRRYGSPSIARTPHLELDNILINLGNVHCLEKPECGDDFFTQSEFWMKDFLRLHPENGDDNTDLDAKQGLFTLYKEILRISLRNDHTKMIKWLLTDYDIVKFIHKAYRPTKAHLKVKKEEYLTSIILFFLQNISHPSQVCYLEFLFSKYRTLPQNWSGALLLKKLDAETIKSVLLNFPHVCNKKNASNFISTECSELHAEQIQNFDTVRDLLGSLGFRTFEDCSESLGVSAYNLYKAGLRSESDFHALGICPFLSNSELDALKLKKMDTASEEKEGPLSALRQAQARAHAAVDKARKAIDTLMTSCAAASDKLAFLGLENDSWETLKIRLSETERKWKEQSTTPKELLSLASSVTEICNNYIDEFSKMQQAYQIAILKKYLEQYGLYAGWQQLHRESIFSLSEYLSANVTADPFTLGTELEPLSSLSAQDLSAFIYTQKST